MSRPDSKTNLAARRAALDAKRAAREAAAAAEQEIKDLEADEQVEELTEKYPNDAVVRTSAGVIVLCKPAATEYRRFYDVDKVTYATILQLVRPCVVYPAHEVFDALLNSAPVILSQLSHAVLALCGREQAEASSK